VETVNNHKDSYEDVVLKVQLARSQIANAIAVIESYEHFGIVRIVDSSKGMAEIYASPDYLKELVSLINSLSLEGFFIKILALD